MPRKAKGARLYWRDGTKKRSEGWVILDTGGIERVTGTRDRSEAERALAAYINERDRGVGGDVRPESLTVDQVLTIYGTEHAPHTKDPARIGYAIDALLNFWSGMTVSQITKKTCRRYATVRQAATSTTRRELGCLSAALAYCYEEGVLSHRPAVLLPEKGNPRDRVLTRDEIARMIRAARSSPRTRHIARYILLALTGTRLRAILALRFERHPGGGYIDVQRGVMYRRAQDAAETKKRKPPVRLPSRLLSHCRRWADEDPGWVVQFKGQRIGSIKTAWRTVCRDAGVGHVTPHTFKHTAITWAMIDGVTLADAAGYFGTSIQTLESDYLHLHPEFQTETAAAMNRAGRRA